MSRSILRALPALLVVSALACASPTAPPNSHPQAKAPSVAPSFDGVPTDSTCRSDYNVGQGRTC
jgi:hypothetical protein